MGGSLLDPDGYYALLGVDVAASSDEITDAYRQQLFKWHPDHSPSPDAADMTRQILNAGLILLDPASRLDYDTKAREAAGYQHEPPPPRRRPAGSDTATHAVPKSRLPVLYSASANVARRLLPQWRQGLRVVCWSSLFGYALILTDNVSRFNPGFYDLSDGLERIREGSDGAQGALIWLIFWVVATLASVVMMLQTRLFRQGNKKVGFLTGVAVLPGAFVAVFSAAPIVLVGVILLGLIAMARLIFGG